MLALPEVSNVLADISTRVPDTVLGHWPGRDSTLVIFEILGGLPNAVQYNDDIHRSNKSIELVVTSNLRNREVTQIGASR